MNFTSPEWVEVREELEKRIHELDVKNRALGPEQQTSYLRGQIAALQSLLHWEKDSAAFPIEPEIQPFQ